MKKISGKFILPVLLLLSTLFMFVPGCTPAQTARFGFNPVLSISEPPALGKTVKVMLTFTTVRPKALEGKKLGYMTNFILTPEKFEVDEDSLESTGDMDNPGETKTVQITLKSVETGFAEITGIVMIVLDGSPKAPENDNLFIYISKDSAIVSDTENYPWPTPERTTTSIPLSSNSTNMIYSTSPEAALTQTVPNDTSISPTSPATSSANVSSSTLPVYPYSELKYKPFEDLAIQADCIIVADVTTAKAERSLPGDKFQGWVYTTFTLTIDKLIKGDAGIKEVFIRLPGGIINDELGYSNAPWMQGGLSLEDKVLVGLKKEDNGYYSGLPWGLPWARKPDGYEYVMTLDTGERLTLEKLLGIMIPTMLVNNIPVALPPAEFPPMPTVTTFPFSPDPSESNAP